MPDVEHSMWRHLLSLSGPGADGAWIRFAGITRSLLFELCVIARLHENFHPRMDEDSALLPSVSAGAPLKMGKRRRDGARAALRLWPVRDGGPDVLLLRVEWLPFKKASSTSLSSCLPPPIGSPLSVSAKDAHAEERGFSEARRSRQAAAYAARRR